MKKGFHRSVPPWALCLLCAGAVLLLCSRSSPLYPTNDWGDANTYFTVGRGILDGLVPYRDLLDQKGPLLFFLHAGAALISSTSFWGVWLLEVAAGAGFLYCSLRSVQLFCPGRRTCLLMLPLAAFVYSSSAFAQGDSAEELCLPLLAFSLYCFLRAFQAGSSWRPSLGLFLLNGIAAGAVFWIKYTLLGLHFAFMASFAFLLWLADGSFKRAVQACAAFLGGMVLISLPVLLYFLYNHSLADLFNVYFLTNFTAYSNVSPHWSVPFYNMAVSGLSTALANPVWAALCIVGFLYCCVRRGVLCAAGRAALTGLVFFTGLFIWGGTMGWPYYGLPLACFAPLGFIPIVALLREACAGRLCRQAGAWAAALIAVFSMAFCYWTSPNISFMQVKKEDLVQTKFARIIRQEGGQSLLNYGFLDGGFYLASEIMPSCRFFCRLNLQNWQELEQPVRQLVKNSAFDFIITREEGPLYDMEGYELVCTEYQQYDGTVFPYSLFRKKN